MSHHDTIRIAVSFCRNPGINLYFNPNLHTKLLVTRAVALVGSANFTWSGMNRNDEIALLISNPREVGALRKEARETSVRRFSVAASDYSFLASLSDEDSRACGELLSGRLTPAPLLALLKLAAEL
jgi:phosphatidylserine/phosphatidylglycerophosphate/cardiolipin synthase-like enzyme